MSEIVPTISWDYISQFSFHHPPREVLERSVEMQKKYMAHNRNLKEKGISVSKYLREQLFPHGGKDTPYIITTNTFPYNMESGIQHFLIWFNPDLESRNWIQNYSKVQEIIADYCAGQNICRDTCCVYFQNLESMRSVKAIPHIHIFWKKKSS